MKGGKCWAGVWWAFIAMGDQLNWIPICPLAKAYLLLRPRQTWGATGLPQTFPGTRKLERLGRWRFWKYKILKKSL